MNPTPIRLLIAEDQTLIAQGYEKMFADGTDFVVVARAAALKSVMYQLQAQRADVLLLDLSMPVTHNSNSLKLSGFEVLNFIREHHIRIRTLVISNHRDYEVVRKAMQLGADGYVLKSIDYQDLVKAIATVSAGKRYLQAEVDHILHHKVGDEDRTPVDGILLTSREMDVLRLVGEGLTTEEMIDSLQLRKDTINEYRQNLMRKFKARNTAHLVLMACRMNLL